MSNDVAKKIKNAEDNPAKEPPEKELLWAVLQQAVEDLDHRDPIIKRQAKWWLFQDSSAGINVDGGYVSLEGICELLDLDPQWVRKKIRKESNGETEK